MAKFLITGANGQVGCALVQQLQGKHQLLALDRSTLDITDRQAVFATVAQFQPDVIINAAAHTAVDRAESEMELAHAINAQGAGYLAEAANGVGAAMLHISTDYVFDGKQPEPYRETDTPNPQSAYGKSKRAGEIAVAQANPKHIILRTAWVFGEQGNNFVKTMLRLAQHRDSLGVVADQFGAPTYAGDIAAALIQIAEKIVENAPVEYGIYHFSGAPCVSWCDFANAIFEQAVLQKILPNAPLVKAITTADYPTAAQRPANSCLNVDKIQRNFGILPSDWQRALATLQDYME